MPTDIDTCTDLGVEAFRPVFASFEDCYGPDLFARMKPDWENTLVEQIRATCANDEAMVAEVDRNIVGFVATTVDKTNGLGDIGLIALSPDRQCRGVGGALIADALDRMREAGMSYATAYTRDHPGHLPVRHLLTRAGFSPLGVQPRTLFCQLEREGTTELPDMVRVGTTDDVGACVRFGIEAFGPVFASFEKLYGTDLFNRLRPDWEKAQAAYIESVCTENETLVSVTDGAVSGFVVLELEVFDGIGAIELLAVNPACDNRGLGTRLNEGALNRLRGAGMAHAVVSTGSDPSHAPARRSYEKVGFAPAPVQWNLMAKRLAD